MPEIRQSAEKNKELFLNDFFEFGSSGSVYHYSDEYFKDEQYPPGFYIGIQDFKIKVLATDVVLATYIATKHHELREEKKYSLRSSIWKCFNGQWKVVFHQGTPKKVD